MQRDEDAPARLRALPSWLVARAALHGARLTAAHFEEEGVRRYHYALLVALREDGPASQAALGRRLSMDRSDLHTAVGELEQDGYVERAPDPADRRRNIVTLTKDGGKKLKLVDAAVDAAQAELLEPLSEPQRRELTRLLTRIVEHHGASGQWSMKSK